MMIPKKLQIAGREIKIINDPDVLGENKAYGMCSYDENIIYLNLSYKNKKHLEVCLIHEILHFANALLGYNISMVDNEKYVNSMAELLYQVIKQLDFKK